MTKRPYNFGDTYELRRHQLDRKEWRKFTEQQRRRLHQLIKRPLTLNHVKQTLERAGIY